MQQTMQGYIDAGIFPRDWSLALAGELQAFTEAAGEAVNKAALSALNVVSTEGKERLRADVMRAGLGRSGAQAGKGTGKSLTNAIRSMVFPNKADPRGPAALIYIQPSAVRIFSAFEQGAKLKAREPGGYITIPVPGSPAARMNFGDNPRGMTVYQALKAKGIEFRTIPPRDGKAGLILARSVRTREDKRGRTKLSRAARTKSGGLAKGAVEVPMFFLVREADIDKRLNLRARFREIGGEFYVAFAREFALAIGRIEAAKREAAELV